uniref:HAUS augmin-like complex, subunit 7 n=1 Tax=Nothobranchius rachovii TaxID=451742 RepID=A0A1A8QRS6_9TELE
MAGPLTEEQVAHQLYDSLQGLYLKEEESMLELLCSPSELRTNILAWTCSRINPNFANSKAARSHDPHALTKEMAAFGHELMLIQADDLDLIRGKASPRRQLRFLEQLLMCCDFLSREEETASVFSPSSLRLAACDLQQLMTTFSHVYEMDFRAFCNRTPPSFTTDTKVFQRVHQQLQACNTELEMLLEVSEASAAVSEEVKQLQTQPRYWSRGEKRTLPDQLEEITQRVGNSFSQFGCWS